MGHNVLAPMNFLIITKLSGFIYQTDCVFFSGFISIRFVLQPKHFDVILLTIAYISIIIPHMNKFWGWLFVAKVNIWMELIAIYIIQPDIEMMRSIRGHNLTRFAHKPNHNHFAHTNIFYRTQILTNLFVNPKYKKFIRKKLFFFWALENSLSNCYKCRMQMHFDIFKSHRICMENYCIQFCLRKLENWLHSNLKVEKKKKLL